MEKGESIIKQPKITASQIISNKEVYQMFGAVKEKAKKNPLFIMEKDSIGTVIISYNDFLEILNGKTEKFNLE
ncbi:hypothetical protein RD055328_12840 [Companilactobacillus sp. RD055328]|uniref:hypothetical protein n=1 Tax=Companilactobacillus sp. RD055328 TaxID=2916634 RepID=UPI001FC7C294|nr:hypothetical protein [Companilactobacillus sp. RD055328]GKQ43361.1 hypothetical protein RD055328_12840 [Companilactobacillus sp. RD055328]